jgi:hypothetical protein
MCSRALRIGCAKPSFSYYTESKNTLAPVPLGDPPKSMRHRSRNSVSAISTGQQPRVKRRLCGLTVPVLFYLAFFLHDEPNYTPGNLQHNNPRSSGPYFNTALFSRRRWGKLGIPVVASLADRA